MDIGQYLRCKGKVFTPYLFIFVPVKLIPNPIPGGDNYDPFRFLKNRLKNHLTIDLRIWDLYF